MRFVVARRLLAARKDLCSPQCDSATVSSYVSKEKIERSFAERLK
jgi:hypothetical protein